MINDQKTEILHQKALLTVFDKRYCKVKKHLTRNKSSREAVCSDSRQQGEISVRPDNSCSAE